MQFKEYTKNRAFSLFHQLHLVPQTHYATIFHASGYFMRYCRLMMGSLEASGEMNNFIPFLEILSMPKSFIGCVGRCIVKTY